MWAFIPDSVHTIGDSAYAEVHASDLCHRTPQCHNSSKGFSYACGGGSQPHRHRVAVVNRVAAVRQREAAVRKHEGGCDAQDDGEGGDAVQERGQARVSVLLGAIGAEHPPDALGGNLANEQGHDEADRRHDDGDAR